MDDLRFEHRVLIVRVRSWLCALRMVDLIETMRSLPVVPFASGTPFLRGVSVVRGAPVPVVDLGMLLGFRDNVRGRQFVVVRCSSRRFCLEVDEVVGVSNLDIGQLEKASPLLSGVAAEYVERLGVLDGEVLAALEPARLIPEEVWHSLAKQGIQ